MQYGFRRTQSKAKRPGRHLRSLHFSFFHHLSACRAFSHLGCHCQSCQFLQKCIKSSGNATGEGPTPFHSSPLCLLLALKREDWSMEVGQHKEAFFEIKLQSFLFRICHSSSVAIVHGKQIYSFYLWDKWMKSNFGLLHSKFSLIFQLPDFQYLFIRSVFCSNPLCSLPGHTSLIF